MALRVLWQLNPSLMGAQAIVFQAFFHPVANQGSLPLVDFPRGLDAIAHATNAIDLHGPVARLPQPVLPASVAKSSRNKVVTLACSNA